MDGPGSQSQGLVGLPFLMRFLVAEAQHAQLVPTLEPGPFGFLPDLGLKGETEAQVGKAGVQGHGKVECNRPGAHGLL